MIGCLSLVSAMSMDNLSFLDDGQSVASTVSQLHHYFSQTHSRYKIKQSELMNRCHAHNAEEVHHLKEELAKLEEAMTLFGVLTDSLSVANRLLHSGAIAKLLENESDVYKIHLEDEAEQTAERAAAQRKLATQNQKKAAVH
jgi:hypothetical protein